MRIAQLLIQWTPVIIIFGAVAGHFVRKIAAARESLRADDLPLILCPVDISGLDRLCDPDEEARLRRELSVRRFNQVQRRRMAAFCQQTRPLSHNASAIQAWANDEYRAITAKNRSQFDERDELFVRIIELADSVKAGVSRAHAKAHLWRVLSLASPMFPVPSISELRESQGFDLLQTYERLKGTFGQLSLTFGVEHYEKVLAAL